MVVCVMFCCFAYSWTYLFFNFLFIYFFNFLFIYFLFLFNFYLFHFLMLHFVYHGYYSFCTGALSHSVWTAHILAYF